MSIEFAIKDISRKWDQSWSYIRAVLIIIAIPTFIIHLINGLGLEIFSDERYFNFTTYDFFLQYYKLIIYFTIAISVSWVLVINHSIITNKSKDLAIMKAVGTIQRTINSFYISELLLIDLIGIILGLLAGYLGYMVIFLIFGLLGSSSVIYIDLIFMPVTIGIIFILSYFVNGRELRKISDKKYAEISSGDIKSGYSAVGGLQLIPKFIANLGFKVKIAVTNLTRKKKQFYRTLLTVALSLSILTTLVTGIATVGNSLKAQIKGAQGENILILGHQDLINTYQQRYEEFSNPTLTFTNQEYDFLDSQYQFNESVIDNIMSDSKYSNIGVKYYDKRLFFYDYAHEGTGIRIIGDFDEYQQVGKERQSFIPVVGLEFKDYKDDWSVFGTINTTEDPDPCALVGDTLANAFFEAAIYQSIRFQDGDTRKYKVTGVFYDSFCAGNASYVTLSSIQTDLELLNKINLVVFELDSESAKDNLIEKLTSDIQLELGTNYKVLDLDPTFTDNLKEIDQLLYIVLIIIIIILLTAIGGLMYYQHANFKEKARDYSIMRAIGGGKKIIKSVMFYEELMVLLISSAIALGVSLNFNALFLISDPFLPSIGLFLLIWILISGIMVILARLSIKIQFSDLVEKKMLFLRVFDK
ncbi:MAG: FtsX-like permease family protein [Candidatus Lokiarchaeota archaeon]|nr:FtsX-like permease family protein [Candidatus Lokiarchaeota archaeon]